MQLDAPVHSECSSQSARPGPPPLCAAAGETRRSDGGLPIWLFVGAVALVAGLRVAGRWQVPLPRCLLRQFTGLPCPTCGCTRSLLAWSHFDLGQAFRFNPLFFVCCVAGLLWLALWLVERFAGRRWLEGLRAQIERWPVGWIFLGLLGLNWLYLCLNLPK